MIRLSDILQAMQRGDEANDLYDQILQQQEEIMGAHSPKLGSYVQYFAIRSFESGNYSNALDLLQRSLSIFETRTDARGRG